MTRTRAAQVKAPYPERLLQAVVRARGFESQFVDALGCRMHYFERTRSASSPTVVLVHGISAGAAHFEKVLKPLYERGYNIIVPDLPGHGLSETPAEPLTADRAFAMLEAFLEKAVAGKFLLVGNSLGGALSVLYALKRPERLEALVAISPAGGFADQAAWDEFRRGLLLQTTADARRFLRRLYARVPWYAPLVAGAILEGFQRPGIQDLLKTTTFESFDESRGVTALRMPILLIWGKEDRIFPAGNLAWFRANLPAHAVIDDPAGVGHCPQLDSARWLWKRLDSYFKSLGLG